MPLTSLGWTDSLAAQFSIHRDAGLVPARVAREDRGRYLLLDEAGEQPGELAGRLRHDARTRAELPAVGDWVATRPGGDTRLIVAVLPRASAFVRKAAGETTDEQIVAANVDTVLLVSGLDGDHNVRRIERFLTAAWNSGAQPVIVLNKADLAADVGVRVAEVQAAAPGVPVLGLSARQGDGLDALAPYLVPGRTLALIGSSGVGKSTLVNALLGDARQATAAVRAADSRGRHTTTHRELIALPGGALLLDTPGMRELQLWTDDSGLAEAFPDVEALATGCRFRDCAHDGEPGCAVLAALASGALDDQRFQSWRKLQRELRHLERRQDARLRAQDESRWRAITNSMKHHPKAHRWRR